MKNCKNCANLDGVTCLVSGYHINVTRQGYGTHCDEKFSAWQPKPTIANKWRKLLGLEDQ